MGGKRRTAPRGSDAVTHTDSASPDAPLAAQAHKNASEHTAAAGGPPKTPPPPPPLVATSAAGTFGLSLARTSRPQEEPEVA